MRILPRLINWAPPLIDPDQIHYILSVADASLIRAVFEPDRQGSGHINELVVEESIKYGYENKVVVDDEMHRVYTVSLWNMQKAHFQVSSPVSDVLQMSLHLTRAARITDLVPGDVPDKLLPSLCFGRPNFQDLFGRMRQTARVHGKKRVAVLVCGPKGMIDETRGLAASMSGTKCTFDFHAEKFDF